MLVRPTFDYMCFFLVFINLTHALPYTTEMSVPDEEDYSACQLINSGYLKLEFQSQTRCEKTRAPFFYANQCLGRTGIYCNGSWLVL